LGLARGAAQFAQAFDLVNELLGTHVDAGAARLGQRGNDVI
jgi:hypothetical protein